MAAIAAPPQAKPLGLDGAQRSQTCEPMNKNRIEGRYGTTSWHNTVTALAALAAPEASEATPQSVPQGG